jgi:hypothetical protein
MPSIAPPQNDEQWVLELWQWVGRAAQYSVNHPVSVVTGTKVHQGLTAALRASSGSIALGILRDGMTIGTAVVQNPGLKSRMAPYFHERGVVLIRFLSGITVEELTAFLSAATLPVNDVFAEGGLRSIIVRRGVVRVHVDELSHDVLEEERAEDRRIRRLRDLFVALLRGVQEARRATSPDDLIELLDEPKLLAKMFEQAEPQRALAQVLAGFADLAQEASAARRVDLKPKIVVVLEALGPEARDRLLLGYAALDGAARQPLADVIATLGPHALARLCLPTVRYHASRLDRFYFALRAVSPDAGVRIDVLRKLARLLYDLPLDEPATHDVMAGLAEPPRDGDPFRFERAVLTKIAARIRDERAGFRMRKANRAPSAEGFEGSRLDGLDHGVATDIGLLSARLVDYADVAARAPATAASMIRVGRLSGAAGVVRALSAVDDPRWLAVTQAALATVVRGDVLAGILADLDHNDERLEALTPFLKAAAPSRADLLFGVLEKTPNRKVRRTLLEVIAGVGPTVLPLVKARLASTEWFVVRNMVTLGVRVGARAQELAQVARHPHAKVRLEVARAMRLLPSEPAASEALAYMVQDPAEEVRSAALSALAEVSISAAAAHSIEASILDEAQKDDVRKRAVEALIRSASDEAAAALFRLLEPRGLLERSFSSELRERAAVGLRRSRAASAAQLFQRGLTSPTWRVRKACEKAMEGGHE